MRVVYKRCAGLDVHKDTVVACVRVQEDDRVSHEVATFGTTTAGLLRLADWLVARRCKHVGLEATGVYWKPVWHMLEEHCELVLANPQEVRNVPGRKSDVNDAAWLSDLLAHGLVRASLVPPRPIQELRDLTRTRKQLTREVSKHTLRIEKVLEDANLKITGVVSNLLGVSGRAILRALISGESDPERLLAVTTGRLRAPRQRLLEGLQGMITEHHRFLLRLHLEHIETLEKAIASLEGRMGELVEPFREQIARLMTIPGVNLLTAQVIVAEIGREMGRFATEANLVSWARLCPRLDESAGKRRSTRLRPGATWLKTALVQSAWGATKVKGSDLRARFLRIKARRGPKKAIMAVAAAILRAAYFILRDDGVTYRDLGATYLDRKHAARAVRRLRQRIEALGYHVEIRPAA